MAISFPASPTEGQVHNHAPGVSFVYRGGAWVLAPRTTALPTNYVVNPTFSVSQQNDVSAGLVNGFYAADQWVWSFVQTPVNYTVVRVLAPTPTPQGGTHYIRFNHDNGPP